MEEYPLPTSTPAPIPTPRSSTLLKRAEVVDRERSTAPDTWTRKSYDVIFYVLLVSTQLRVLHDGCAYWVSRMRYNCWTLRVRSPGMGRTMTATCI